MENETGAVRIGGTSFHSSTAEIGDKADWGQFLAFVSVGTKKFCFSIKEIYGQDNKK